MPVGVARGRRPGPSTTREEVLAATRRCLEAHPFDQVTLRLIAEEAGVSNSLLIHQFGSRENLLAEALAAPTGLNKVIHLLRRFPRVTWGRVVAQALHRGYVRDEAARRNLELLLRASASSDVCARIVSDWVSDVMQAELAALGLSHPELRARALTSFVFGATFSESILSLEPLSATAKRARVRLHAALLQHVLASEL